MILTVLSNTHSPWDRHKQVCDPGKVIISWYPEQLGFQTDPHPANVLGLSPKPKGNFSPPAHVHVGKNQSEQLPDGTDVGLKGA